MPDEPIKFRPGRTEQRGDRPVHGDRKPDDRTELLDRETALAAALLRYYGWRKYGRRH